MDRSLKNTQCVILAAGVSTRLRPLTNDLPKCLLEVNGKTLLQRILDNVYAVGIRSVAIVIGFQAERIREYLRNQFPQRRFRYILNPHYQTTNNAYSLLLARKFMENEDGAITNDLLMLDSDLIFSPQLLTVFLSHHAADKIAVRIHGGHNEEEIGIRIDAAGTIAAIGKNISGTVGESVGIEYFSSSAALKLFDVLEQRIRSGCGRTEFYENSFQQLIDEGVNVSMVNIDSYPVMEIDTIADLQHARSLNFD
jgi:choline kinase